ncbi:hydrogenase-4 subunit E [Leptospira kanakyensis]|uniref:Hydrogenase-4 subunit E n=1 Tax=Leptospira kanakyensis TaxID=2484968 RepID=A0A6N4Q9F2_9LEPT|nr:hydrogenase-4 subunit E [Leptospira kanakyensis]TGK49307.1 hydrogenase-4 subunit E [Leptospira kanakyensis]TGK60452.1 hydrogenase-4 subunit E [Leptospira kanakyensis]TGK67850.1 hydrogenase-4 subunit E [Leptospira kanakyensis]
MEKITGVTNFDGVYHQFVIRDQKMIREEVKSKKSNIDFLLDPQYPVWLVRHAFGQDMGLEDYSELKEEDYLSDNRGKTLSLHQKTGVVRDLSYHGLHVPFHEGNYSHAVGPIHAGIIEPGHFRFVVEGEVIRHLTIRLGFQHRAIREKMFGKSVLDVMPLSETISGDTSVGYAVAFSKIYEEMYGIPISKDVTLFRFFLIELERIAVHIGDLGGISEDIGYYPLYGVCVTDRGAALGLMETWTGNRFGKAAIRPGRVRVNGRISAKQAKEAFFNLKKVYFKRIRPQILRALSVSTLKERMQGCGFISELDVEKHGFSGMIARMAGVGDDLRINNPDYPGWVPLPIKEEHHHYNGDVWARMYIRYAEIEQSLKWIESHLDYLDFKSLWSENDSATKPSQWKEWKPKAGIYTASVEAWRGPVLVSLDIDTNGFVKNSYIRDPSVLNWHALELAVRGEQIGDFPLNNKSFNLSYVGFDL